MAYSQILRTSHIPGRATGTTTQSNPVSARPQP